MNGLCVVWDHPLHISLHLHLHLHPLLTLTHCHCVFGVVGQWMAEGLSPLSTLIVIYMSITKRLNGNTSPVDCVLIPTVGHGWPPFEKPVELTLVESEHPAFTIMHDAKYLRSKSTSGNART